MNRLALLAVTLLLISIPFATAEEDAPIGLLATPIAVDGGQITGAASEKSPGVVYFKGVPYAAPPVGDLRWKDPQPPVAWQGVRECRAFSKACPQPVKTEGIVRNPGPQDEDCLYLNIWTSASDNEERRPVMFWIHGGCFTQGSGSQPYYDGEYLASVGYIVVTINYRLGPFGFFAHPALSKESPHGTSGNYGLLDMIYALEWVKRNIASFGGDPANVTIFGESAGASAVTCLLVSPLARDLFHRAISQSGTNLFLKQRTKETATGPRGNTIEPLEKTGLELQKKWGIEDGEGALSAMRALGARELLDKADPVVGILQRGLKFGPVIDGRVITEEPIKTFERGGQAPVPLMIGSTRDEATIFMQAGMKDMKELAYRAMVRAAYRENTDDVLALFPPDREGSPAKAFNRLVTIATFTWPAKQIAELHSKVCPDTWFYQFERVMPIPQTKELGAFHGSEIPYAFGNINDQRVAAMLSETDRALGRAMSTYWGTFALSGNPNSDGAVNWPAYEPDTDQHMIFGDKVEAGQGAWAKECELMRRISPEGGD